MRAALSGAVLHCGHLGFVAAWWLDRLRGAWRRQAGPVRHTRVVGGVTLALPPGRPRYAATFYRDWVLQRRERSPSVSWPYPRVVSGPDPTALPAPMVLATFHIGPLRALGGLVQRLPGPVCVLFGGGQVTTRRARFVRTVGGEQQRVAAVMEALHTLRAGGYALLVVDGLGTARVEQTLLGRRVSLARGAFALARLADAPLLPVTVRWRRAGVEIVAGQAIAPADETTMAGALVTWLEGYLRQHPGEFSFPQSRHLGFEPGDR